jgi:hypothetical protein
VPRTGSTLAALTYLRLVWVGAALLVVACGNGRPPLAPGDGGVSDGLSAGGGPTSAVRGSWINRRGLGGEVGPFPLDLSGAVVRAWLHQPGGMRALAGAGTAGGTFEVPAVPEGPFLLEVRLTPTNPPRIVSSAGSQRSFDLGSDAFGYPGDLPIAGPGTQVAFELAGIAPWVEGDTFQLLYESGFQYTTNSLPDVRPLVLLTVLHGSRRHIDGPGLGHRTYLVHRGVSSLPGGATLTAPRAAVITTAVKTVEGQTVTVPLSLAVPPTGASQVVDIRRREYLQFRAQVGVAAGAPKLRVSFHRLPPGLSLREWGLSELVALEQGAGEDDVQTEVKVPAFLPAEWREVRRVEVVFPTPCWLPGAMQPLVNEAVMRTIDEGPEADAPVRPLLGPPRLVTIAGRPAEQSLANVGPEPVIRWEAPAVGQASGYRVYVRRLEARLDSVVETWASSIATERREVTLPPGFLEMGYWYRIEIRAEQRPGGPLESPWRDRLPLREASTFTGAFTL